MCGGCMNNPKHKETLGLSIITARFKSSEEKGKPAKECGRESAKAFVEERVSSSILSIYGESVAAEIIRNINNAKKETAVVRSFGGSVSLSCLNRHRMVDGFESKKAAEVRTLKNITDINEGLKRQHDHVGDLEKLSGQMEFKCMPGLCE